MIEQSEKQSESEKQSGENWFEKMRIQHTTFIAMTITVLSFALN